MAIALAIILPPKIAPFLPHFGMKYLVQPVILPQAAAETPQAPAAVLSTSTPPSLTVRQIRDYILKEAQASGVNVQKAQWIVQHESGDCWREGFYNPAIEGHEPNGTTSYGCWQFNKNKKNSSTFDMGCVTNFECSTKLAMQWILAGRINEWSTYAFCRRDYSDCPF